MSSQEKKKMSSTTKDEILSSPYEGEVDLEDG